MGGAVAAGGYLVEELERGLAGHGGEGAEAGVGAVELGDGVEGGLAVGAAVLAGLAVSVLPESALRSGMRVLGPADDFPTLPSCKIALVRNRADPSPLCDALAGHIVSSLDNLSAATDKVGGEDPLS